jgi:DNA-binding PadR family transcriptional regulator
LYDEPAHGYAIGTRARNISLGSWKVTGGTLYPLLKKMVRRQLVSEIGLIPTGKPDTARLHYQITQEGEFRLKEETKRLRHAVQIAEDAGLMNYELPIEIQRLMAALKA